MLPQIGGDRRLTQRAAGGTRCIELQMKKVGYLWNGSLGRLEIAVVLGDVFGPRTS
jgi:hypothetical protein